MKHEHCMDMLEEANPDALVLEEYKEALVGVAKRCGQPVLAVYDVDKIIDILMDSGMSFDDANEHFSFNIAGSWVGENTPLFLYT